MNWKRAPSDELITLELMLRAIEILQQRPEYQNQPIEKLTGPAHDLLAKCNWEREIAYNSWVSYHGAIALVTGFTRIRPAQVALFEQFYTEVCQSNPSGRCLENLNPQNYFPVWACKKMAFEFKVWDANRRSKMAKDKNNLKKPVAHHPRAKKTT